MHAGLPLITRMLQVPAAAEHRFRFKLLQRQKYKGEMCRTHFAFFYGPGVSRRQPRQVGVQHFEPLHCI